MLERNGIYIPATYYETEYTYISGSHHTAKNLDYVATPINMVKGAYTFTKSAVELQLIRHHKRLDHAPIGLKLQMAILWQNSKKAVGMDRTGIMECLLHGKKRDTLLAKIDEQCAQNQSQFDNIWEEQSPTKQYEIIRKIVHDNIKRYIIK